MTLYVLMDGMVTTDCFCPGSPIAVTGDESIAKDFDEKHLYFNDSLCFIQVIKVKADNICGLSELGGLREKLEAGMRRHYDEVVEKERQRLLDEDARKKEKAAQEAEAVAAATEMMKGNPKLAVEFLMKSVK